MERVGGRNSRGEEGGGREGGGEGGRKERRKGDQGKVRKKDKGGMEGGR